MLRIPYGIDSWLTDGIAVVSFMRQPLAVPENPFYFYLWYSILVEAE
jgi:hypothetical protein